jgi:putative phosphoserine phosphatase/1-acylglycerol-3-phosphate O-acyltransferase
VKGEEHLWSHRPAVFTFNHQSSLDALVVGSLVRRDLTAVAKKEAARDPRFAPIGLLADVAYIDRKNSTKARSALTPVVEKIQSGMSLAIAPEGTRTPTPHIAMQAGVPIVPIVLRNTGSLMWRGSSVVRQGTVEVVVLPPVATDGWHAEDIDRHVDEIRESYVNTFEELGGPPVATAEKEVVRT